MTLLQECIGALKPNIEIIKGDDSNKLFKSFEKLFVFTEYGRIDWSYYKDKLTVKSLNDLYNLPIEKCTIFWNDDSLPVIKTDFKLLLDNIDDVLAVSFDTWVLSESNDIVIEFFHDDKIQIVNLTD